MTTSRRRWNCDQQSIIWWPVGCEWLWRYDMETLSALPILCGGNHWLLQDSPHRYSISHMMTSSNGNIFRVTGPLCGEFTGPGEFPTQRPVMRSFDVNFDLRLNKPLSKQSWGWWFETLLCPLWRHSNEEICTRFCCALLCCGYAIVHNEFTWSIYPYSSGLLCWHWGNR